MGRLGKFKKRENNLFHMGRENHHKIPAITSRLLLFRLIISANYTCQANLVHLCQLVCKISVFLTTFRFLSILAWQWHLWTNQISKWSSWIFMIMVKISTLSVIAHLSCAPKLWNQLPIQIRNSTCLSSFKSTLKTHLFKLAYDL